jgi:phenylalanine-4-hydroxylase
MPTSPVFRPPIAETPPHLRIYLSRQDYSLYTPMDQASWRFIQKVGRPFFAEHAHAKYLDGLRETGITPERIPRIEEMDEKLRRFGWRAVPVIGFIPPAAFLEFQAHGLLPIACDMRKIENLNYTPAPDIVHEAAGHAPILADPAYAAYLRGYGEVSRRAIFSSENMEVYYAVRRLSDTKERPDASPAEVEEAEEHFRRTLAGVTYDSEVDWVTRLGWWTTEYGLVGDLESPKIYGAGLLSSIGESYHCLSDRVRKIPFGLECIHTPFNITEPQPQLFVTPDFDCLNTVLEELAGRLAFRRGGAEGLATAQRGATVCTVELDSGLQMSGVVEEFATGGPGAEGEAAVAFLRLRGPVQLACADAELPGHGPRALAGGLFTPLGALRGEDRGADRLSPDDLAKRGFAGGGRGRLEFASGFVLEGVLRDRVEREGRALLLSFSDCLLTRGGETFHRPAGGPFQLACGGVVRSVFGGAADRFAYLQATEGVRYEPGTHKTNLTCENGPLNDLYARVREVREEGRVRERMRELDVVAAELERAHPHDWLLRWELLELDREHGLGAAWRGPLRERLRRIREDGEAEAESIDRGLRLLG